MIKAKKNKKSKEQTKKKGASDNDILAQAADETPVLQSSDFAIDRIYSTVLTYSVEPDTTALQVILKEVGQRSVPIMVNMGASIRYADLSYLNEMLQSTTGLEPNDYVSPATASTAIDSDDVEVEIL